MAGEASGRVMIVDDDPVIQQLMLASLESQGCEVVRVGTGAEAIELALVAPPDVILLDVLLPDIDGIVICRRIRAEPLLAELPIIMITALHEPDVRLRSLEAGADDFIAKPVDFLELRARVGSILRLNRYRQLLNERTQRQRAEDEVLRRNRDLMLLNNFIIATAARLHTPHQLQETLSDACGVLVQTFRLAQARVWLTLDDGGDALVAAVPPDDPPQQRAVHGAGSLRVAPATPLSDALPALLPADPAIAADVGGPSPLTIPILLSGRTSGEFTLFAAGERAFDGQDRAFAQSLAGAVGQAIEAALLHQQLQRHVDTLEEIVATRTDELLAERDRTQAILEALGEAVIVTDPDWTIRYVNPSTSVLTGYESGFLAGLRWSDLQATGDPLYRFIGDHVRSGQTWRGEIIGVRHDGSRYDAAMTVAPIFDPLVRDGPAGLVSIQRDITPLKAAERLKERFVSNVSHELRTPLSIIALHSGNLDTLYDRLGDERRRHLIREVRTQAALLDDLIGDVLELSRIDSGSLPTDSRSLDLAELLGREVALLLPLAERNGLTLEMDAAGPLAIRGDEAQLRQCIRNLISNAIKFTPTGGRISCACRVLGEGSFARGEWPSSGTVAAGPWAGLQVTDSGIGIDPAHLPHLFERFYRVQNQTSVPGTGLGLAITRELVTRHGGWTAVASTLHVGSTFAFYLPLAQQA